MVKRARLSDIINNESNVERKGKIASLVPDSKDRCYYDAMFLKNLFSVINSVFIHVGVECLSEGEGKNLWCGYISFVTVKGLSVMDLKCKANTELEFIAELLELSNTTLMAFLCYVKSGMSLHWSGPEKLLEMLKFQLPPKSGIDVTNKLSTFLRSIKAYAYNLYGYENEKKDMDPELASLDNFLLSRAYLQTGATKMEFFDYKNVNNFTAGKYGCINGYDDDSKKIAVPVLGGKGITPLCDWRNPISNEEAEQTDYSNFMEVESNKRKVGQVDETQKICDLCELINDMERILIENKIEKPASFDIIRNKYSL